MSSFGTERLLERRLDILRHQQHALDFAVAGDRRPARNSRMSLRTARFRAARPFPRSAGAGSETGCRRFDASAAVLRRRLLRSFCVRATIGKTGARCGRGDGLGFGFVIDELRIERRRRCPIGRPRRRKLQRNVGPVLSRPLRDRGTAREVQLRRLGFRCPSAAARRKSAPNALPAPDSGSSNRHRAASARRLNRTSVCSVFAGANDASWFSRSAIWRSIVADLLLRIERQLAGVAGRLRQ